MKIRFPVLTFRPGSFFAPTGTATTESGWGYRINRNPGDPGYDSDQLFFFLRFLAGRGSGCYENSITGQRYPLGAGSVFLRRPEVEHLIRVDAESGWLEYWLHLGNFAWPFFRNYLSLRDDNLTGYFDPSPEWFAVSTCC